MTTISITPDQEKQFKRFVEDVCDRALKEVAPDKDGLQRLIERGGEFQAHIATGIRRFTAKTPDYELAKTILGKDFISPEEVAKARKVSYTDEQLLKFGETLTAREVLKWCRDNGYMLLAGPPKEMSLIDIRALHNAYFYSKEGGWYANDTEQFSRDDKVGTAWVMIRKEPVPNSTSKTWNDQQAFLFKVEVVPNAAATAWAITTYKAVRSIYLLPSIHVRTSSCDSYGVRVYVGNFGDDGLYVSRYCGNEPVSSVGVASARK